jgi:hypothetical protein
LLTCVLKIILLASHFESNLYVVIKEILRKIGEVGKQMLEVETVEKVVEKENIAKVIIEVKKV